MPSRQSPSGPGTTGDAGPAALAPRTLLWGSVAVALVTIVLKTLAWHLTGSVGLLSDALESFVNLAGAIFALAMVTVAQRPADDDHPYGHHKAEYFSSGFEGILIVGAAAAIFWAAAHRLSSPQPLEQVGWGLALSVASSALNGGLAWLMFRSARVHRSVALEGDARHLVTDVWTSAGVVVGIGAASATGWLWLDPVVAMAVALNILKEGGHMVWRASQGLMDAAVEPEAQAAIDAALQAFAQAEPQVRFDHLATRQAGQRRFAGLHMHVPADWSLGRAAQLRGAVEAALMHAVPGLRVTIELLPVGVEAFLEEPKDSAP
ncbi:cation diffusion facilitator family transporter [Paracidovorax valerianellae]|uniref:Cation diffusion facilitator family transporter n=1 Tax=Paracidovorax valerianellae TaxID=187868 RepID=A0A1G6QAY7_9BURK|nr:cation diffusion facilitator family transporter [Paracidovorax valerianellae]MDA8444415.1 cation diffusion facilitator family transporter [Paracidovorax valerianellae]SDC89672.1 cation diffusion facilitator family transporter [Paracidovorax valerianellae]